MDEQWEPTAYLEVNAGNDVDGNPRRAAVIYGFKKFWDDGTVSASILDVIDEGYEGCPEWVKRLGYLGQFPVPVRRYQALLRDHAS
jgi:hypothetical protein